MAATHEMMAERFREIRREQFGERGIEALCTEMRIPSRTWENIERGAQTPGQVILRFLVITGVDPRWLLTGEGHRYRESFHESSPRLSP